MSSLEADFLAENDYDFLNNSQYSIENYRMVKSREQQLRNEMSRQSKESRQRSRITNRNPQNRSESKQSTAVIQREPTQTQIFRNCDFTDGNQQNYYEPKLPIKKEIIKGQTFQNSNTSAANKAEETKKFEESKIENSISISSNKSLTDYFITKVNKIRRSRTLNEDQIYELELQRKKLLESIFEARQLPTAEALNKKFEDGSGDRKVLRHNRSSTVPSYVANVEPKSPNVGLESNLPIYGDELFKRVIRTSGKNRSNNGSPAVPQTRHLTLPNSNRRLQEPLEGHIRLNDDVLPLARPSTSETKVQLHEATIRCLLPRKVARHRIYPNFSLTKPDTSFKGFKPIERSNSNLESFFYSDVKNHNMKFDRSEIDAIAKKLSLSTNPFIKAH